MKRISLNRLAKVRADAEAMSKKIPSNHPGKLMFGVLALRAAGLDPGGPTTTLSNTELAAFEDYCEVRGSDRKYFDPFTGRKYKNWRAGSGGSRFQNSAVLTQSGKLKVEGNAPKLKDYTLEPDYLEVVKDSMLPQDGTRIPLAGVVALRFRYQKLDPSETVETLLDKVKAELRLSDKEVDTIFGPVDLAVEADAFFTEDDWSDDALIDVLGMGDGTDAENDDDDDDDQIDTWEAPDDDDLISSLYAEFQAMHFDVSKEFLANFITGIRTDRFVVLAGKPGTGKTRFIKRFADALRRIAVGGIDVRCFMFPVTEETAEWQVIGMRNLDGEYVPSELMKAVSDLSPSGVAFAVFDEMNLAPVDVYGARLISAVTNGIPFELPGEKPPALPGAKGLSWYPSNGEWQAPAGLVIVGTINSPLHEPNRFHLSGPVKRRANVIPMPDKLAELAAEAKKDEGSAQKSFDRLCFALLEQLRDEALTRSVSALDKPVSERLGEFPPVLTCDVLWSLAKAVATDPLLPITLGLVKSILGYVLIAPAALPEPAAIDNQLVQKFIPLLRGNPSVLDRIEDALTQWLDQLPNTKVALAELRSLGIDAGHISPAW